MLMVVLILGVILLIFQPRALFILLLLTLLLWVGLFFGCKI